jgi:formimidoylglutamate deiminase
VSVYFARHALLPGGWAENVRFEVDTSGRFASVTPDSAPSAATLLRGLVVAGMPNVHSHAFQRAFAGRTERAGPAGDSFWTWREAMYEMLETIEPDEFETIAAATYATMLEAGYTNVCEFHYVHNARGGVPYARRTELADRIVCAARRAGIGLTLIPVLYRFSDFGETPPAARQLRFVLSFDAFAELWRELGDAYGNDPQIALGIAPHSLRAVSLDDLPQLVELADALGRRNVPIHMHASEQVREVDACLATHGTTPIALLAQLVELGPRWCLIHCTHATGDERRTVVEKGAVAGLCPTTEASLGDGIFPAARFVRDGGRIAVGTDSNVSIDVAEELRWLEYVQRLASRERNLMHADGAPFVGRYLYEIALRGGAQAAGRPVGALAPGASADLVALNCDAGTDPDSALGVALFRSGAWDVRDVVAGGRHAVRDGRHIGRARENS